MSKLRKYSEFDLLRFHHFANEEQNKGLSGVELVVKFNKEFPAQDPGAALRNLRRFLFQEKQQ